jgi:hypothetical protein
MFVPSQPITFWAVEQSTAIFRAAFSDENGSACSASAAVWTLSDESGNVINSRTNVPIAGSGSAVTVVLGALDTKRQTTEPYIAGANYLRVLRIAATYNSPTTGQPAPLVTQYVFGILPVPVEGP